MNIDEALKILELDIHSNPDDVKKAYKEMAKKYHPDIYQGNKEFAEEKMKQINEAYSTLDTYIKQAYSTDHFGYGSPNYEFAENFQKERYERMRAEDARKAEAQRKYEEEMQKIREEAERIQKELEEQIKLREKFLKLFKPILIILFFALEFYLVKILILAINSIQLSFSEANWFFFAFWILLGILAVIFNIGVPAGLIWLFKKAKIFKRKK